MLLSTLGVHLNVATELNKIETDFTFFITKNKMNVDSYETSLNTACGRTTTFKNKKQMNTWIRLHKKKCDRCNHATFNWMELEVQHDWGNRNELENAIARGNALADTLPQFIGEDSYVLPPRNTI